MYISKGDERKIGREDDTERKRKREGSRSKMKKENRIDWEEVF